MARVGTGQKAEAKHRVWARQLSCDLLSFAISGGGEISSELCCSEIVPG